MRDRAPSRQPRASRVAGLAVMVLLALAGQPRPAETTGAPGQGRRVAQAPAAPGGRPVTIRGTIASVDGARLRVATANGEETVTLAEPLTVVGATTARLTDLVPGTFLGTAARALADGTFRALEVHIFAESMRGAGEGHRPMEAPGTTMTNANVDAVVQQAEGPLLTLVHKDGTTRVVVPPEAPIVRFAPGDARLLLPGASIVVFRALRADDGSLRASRITVGVDGTRLPM